MTGRLCVRPDTIDKALPGLHQEQAPIISPNLAPRRGVSTVRLSKGSPRLNTLFWGLTPSWLAVLDHAPHCARAETLDSRPMFKDAFETRRCLVPVAGFYAWREGRRGKHPYLVTRVNRAPLLLAAIWCRYHTTEQTFHDSMALITVPANALLAPLSDRVPAVIAPDQMAQWLDPQSDLEQVNDLLAPAALELLGAFPVSKDVNNPACQASSCCHPIGAMLQWATTQEP